MNILVTRSNLAHIIEKLNKKNLLVFDCETTGLKPYHGARIFSLAISDETDNYYFNFKSYPLLDSNYVLERCWVEPLVTRSRTWIAHNAKFDLHFMDKEGIRPVGPVIDTEVMARMFNNMFQYSGGYSLAACVKRWLSEAEKDDRVKNWMDENNAFTTHFNFEGKAEKIYFFDQVPFEIISEYAMMDGEITMKLYKFLRDNMYENKAQSVEIELTPVLFEMEKLGLLVDREYCERAYAHELNRIENVLTILRALCGGDFTDSAKFLAPLLTTRGFTIPATEAGNPQVTNEVLSQFPDPLAKAVLEYRDSMKRAHTYFSAYLTLSDEKNVIHPNFRQAITTGRMSCFSPNLQNLPNAEDDKDLFPIRKVFIPRPGFFFVSIDYAQMEFRLMLEYANQEDLIEKIKKGHDPHDSTAELTGLSRKSAKTLNFGLLYGMGIAKLAKAIGVTDGEAKDFKWTYFGKLPGVKRFIKQAQYAQADRGFTFNWAGRRFYIDDPKWAYKAANSIIQGGCADICKLAMVRLQKYLVETGKRSRMVLQVHDEILFEVALDEASLVGELRRIMSEAYEAKNMPLTCSVSYSYENFHDMIEVGDDGIPMGSAQKSSLDEASLQLGVVGVAGVCDGQT